MSFAERLTALRTERGLTQLGLATAVKVSRSAISLYELGARQPELGTVQRLADFFGVTVDYLLGRTEVRGPVETIATHRTDGYEEPLPQEAAQAIEEFAEFIRKKYGPGGTHKPPGQEEQPKKRGK